jgi:protein-tyrosine phosphatase
MVQRADLVLTATREHRVAVVSLDPQALPRTFTLREFARLVRTLPADPAALPANVVSAVAAARGSARVPPSEDDVADPYGGPLRSYRRCRDVITDAVDTIVPLLVGHDAAGREGRPRAGLQ